MDGRRSTKGLSNRYGALFASSERRGTDTSTRGTRNHWQCLGGKCGDMAGQNEPGKIWPGKMTRRGSDLLFLYQNCHGQADFEVRGKRQFFKVREKSENFVKSHGE